MEERTIILTPALMRRIARYETTFGDITQSDFSDGNIICPDVYAFTLDDLCHAIKALEAADPTVGEFSENWFQPISRLSSSFDLENAFGGANGDADVPEDRKGYPGLRVSDSAWFRVIWKSFETVSEHCYPELRLSEIIDYDMILSDLDRYFSNKGKPIEEWAFSDEEMEIYIAFFEHEKFVREATEPQLALARKFIDQLCEEGSRQALHVKGYACYGGDRLYPCDWSTARDCMLRLYEMTDEPQYANTLGYIYYYGRCSGGVPNYDKAFHFFGIAAANGLYEGMYKLADMYRHGFACRKSDKTAKSLYRMVYEDSFPHFLEGDHTSFADAALRMGNVYARGIDEEIDLYTAYFYYLQADYAAKLRAMDSDFFGDAAVVNNARKALESVRKQLPEDFFEEYLDFAAPRFLAQLAEKSHRCELSRMTDAEGHIRLLAKRVPSRSVPEPSGFLLTLPQLSFCVRTMEISCALADAAEMWFKGGEDAVRYDSCEWNDDEKRCEFYYDDELVAWTKSEYYRFYGEPEEEPA